MPWPNLSCVCEVEGVANDASIEKEDAATMVRSRISADPHCTLISRVKIGKPIGEWPSYLSARVKSRWFRIKWSAQYDYVRVRKADGTTLVRTGTGFTALISFKGHQAVKTGCHNSIVLMPLPHRSFPVSFINNVRGVGSADEIRTRRGSIADDRGWYCSMRGNGSRN